MLCLYWRIVLTSVLPPCSLLAICVVCFLSISVYYTIGLSISSRQVYIDMFLFVSILWLFIGGFNPFRIKVINYKDQFIFEILLFVFSVCCMTFLWLISYITVLFLFILFCTLFYSGAKFHYEVVASQEIEMEVRWPWIYRHSPTSPPVLGLRTCNTVPGFTYFFGVESPPSFLLCIYCSYFICGYYLRLLLTLQNFTILIWIYNSTTSTTHRILFFITKFHFCLSWHKT